MESTKISSWESKGLPNEKISTTTSNNNNKFATSLIYLNTRLKVNFNGDFLKQDKFTYNYGPIVNIYISYKLIPDTKDPNITLENCLFGAVKLTINADVVLDIQNMVLDLI